MPNHREEPRFQAQFSPPQCNFRLQLGPPHADHEKNPQSVASATQAQLESFQFIQGFTTSLKRRLERAEWLLQGRNNAPTSESFGTGRGEAPSRVA
jgi:hypothetical protein